MGENAVPVNSCSTCRNLVQRNAPANEPLSQFKVCRHDPNHPGARFADHDKPCYLVPVKWEAKA